MASLPRAPATVAEERDRAARSPAARPRAADGAARTLVCAVLLAGPVALCFFSGGVQEEPRTAAAIVVWASVAVAAVVWMRPPLPNSRAGIAAAAGLGGLAAWVFLSSGWAPLRWSAEDDGVRLALYVGAFLLAATAWPSRAAARLAEPAIAAGAALVVVYGLSERLLPDLVALDRSAASNGLLEQPIAYWNAIGVVAAMGIVLCTRLAGDATRPANRRTVAAAVTPLLCAGLALTQSRGAFVAAAAGVALLVLLAPERRQLRAALIAIGTGAAACAVVVALPAVRTLDGSAGERRLQGLAALVMLVAVVVSAALLERRFGSARGRAALPPPGRALAPLCVVALAALLVPVVLGSGAGVGSNRDDYWRVAAGTFADHPLRGAGTGAFATEWARERRIEESVRDAHSLYVETAAELGLVGLGLLGLFAGALTTAARRAHRIDALLAAGPCAALAAFAAHAAVDWDWEIPAVTLPALVLAGLLVWRASMLRPPAGAGRRE